VDDYVDVGSDSSLDTPNALTVEVWVRNEGTKPTASGEYYGIVQKGGLGSGGSWDLRWHTDGNVYFFVRYPDDSGYNYAGPVSVSKNTWHHIVGVFKPQLIELYIDGVKKDDTSIAYDTINTNTANVLISHAAPHYFDGLIDEVRIYNRALSVAEIRYHYNRGGPVAHWKFDEGSGTTTYDGTNNNNDGTLGDGTCTPGQHPSSCPAWITGKYGSALQFDGADDYVDAGTDASLDPADHSYTAEAWFKSNTPSTGRDTIIRKATSDLESRVHLWIFDGRLSGTIYDALGNFANVSGGTITGNWQHGALVVDREQQKMFLYLDGTLIDTADISTVGSLTTTQPLRIGGTDRPWDGLIDEVKIYNYARTLEQIRIDYNAGLSTHFR
jgi:hypothetical protein